MRPCAAALVAASCLSVPLAAQTPAAPAPAADTVWHYPWLLSYFPFLSGGIGNGPVASVRIRYFQPSPDHPRVAYRAALTFDAGLGLHGSRYATARFDAPLLTPRFRVAVLATATRDTRARFFGVGNDRVFEHALETDSQPYYYRATQNHYLATADLSYRVTGPALVSVLGGLQRDEFGALPGPSVFASDYGGSVRQGDFFGRVAAVLDTRNTEYDPSRGVLLEAGLEGGTGGGGYHRWYGLGRGYLGVTSTTTVAAQLGASNLDGDPPLAARYFLPTWERTLAVYGGSRTNRALETSRYVGTGLLFGSAEVRQLVANIRHAAFISVVTFVDAGRVFENESFRITARDLHVGGGAGLAVRLLRGTTFVGNGAFGPDGFKLSVSGGWAF